MPSTATAPDYARLARRALNKLLDNDANLEDKDIYPWQFSQVFHVVKTLLEQTGFPKGLYSKEELDRSLYLYTTQKIAFLNKLVLAVAYTLEIDPPLTAVELLANPNPETTYGFVRKLADAAAAEGSAAAIKKVRGETTPVKPDDDSDLPSSNRGVKRTLAELGHNLRPTPVPTAVTRLTRHSLRNVMLPENSTEDITSDETLSRLSFRDLYNVTQAVMKCNKFGKGLFTVEEMRLDNLKFVRDKITYLNKFIDLVILLSEADSNPFSAAAMIAGLEKEKTNSFLQELGEVASVLPMADEDEADLSQEQKDALHLLESAENKIVRQTQSRAPSTEPNTDKMMEQRLLRSAARALEKVLSYPVAPKDIEHLPFVSLHELIVNVMDQTGFASGLYSRAELDAVAMGGTKVKLEYLNKIVDVTNELSPNKKDFSAAAILGGSEHPAGFLEQLALLSNDPKVRADPVVTSVRQRYKNQAGGAANRSIRDKRANREDKASEDAARDRAERSERRSRPRRKEGGDDSDGEGEGRDGNSDSERERRREERRKARDERRRAREEQESDDEKEKEEKKEKKKKKGVEKKEEKEEKGVEKKGSRRRRDSEERKDKKEDKGGMDEEAAATRIQAQFRGHQVRKNQRAPRKDRSDQPAGRKGRDDKGDDKDKRRKTKKDDDDGNDGDDGKVEKRKSKGASRINSKDNVKDRGDDDKKKKKKKRGSDDKAEKGREEESAGKGDDDDDKASKKKSKGASKDEARESDDDDKAVKKKSKGASRANSKENVKDDDLSSSKKGKKKKKKDGDDTTDNATSNKDDDLTSSKKKKKKKKKEDDGRDGDGEVKKERRPPPPPSDDEA